MTLYGIHTPDQVPEREPRNGPDDDCGGGLRRETQNRSNRFYSGDGTEPSMESILNLPVSSMIVALVQAHSHKKLTGFSQTAEICHERSSQAPGVGLGRNCRSLPLSVETWPRLVFGPKRCKGEGRTGEVERGGAGGPATHAQRSSAAALRCLDFVSHPPTPCSYAKI